MVADLKKKIDATTACPKQKNKDKLTTWKYKAKKYILHINLTHWQFIICRDIKNTAEMRDPIFK